MKAANAYPDRLEWLKRVAGGGGTDGFGQKTDAYPSQGYLWGALEDRTGGRTTEQERERQQATATIRLRNFTAVVAGYRLKDGYGETWTVESVVRGDQETVCDVTRPKWTSGGGMAQ